MSDIYFPFFLNAYCSIEYLAHVDKWYIYCIEIGNSFRFLFKKKHYCFSGMGRHSMVRKLSCGHRVAGFVSRRLVKYRTIYWCLEYCTTIIQSVFSILWILKVLQTRMFWERREGVFPRGFEPSIHRDYCTLYNRIPEGSDLFFSPKHACLQNFKLQKITF